MRVPLVERREYGIRDLNFRLVCLRTRRIPGLSGYIACSTVTAYPIDVGDKCNLRHFVSWLNCYRGRSLQHRQHHPGIHRRRLLNHKRRRRLRDYRPDAEDVQEKEVRTLILAFGLRSLAFGPTSNALSQKSNSNDLRPKTLPIQCKPTSSN